MNMAVFAVERHFSSGCWDSNGHEALRVYRYKCADFESAVERYRRVLEDPLTKRARIMILNERTGRYESVASGDQGAFFSDISLPVGFSDRHFVQSALFRRAFPW